MSSTVSGWVLITLGILTMVGAVLNWGVVSRPGKLLNVLLGDTVARIIYFAVGIFVFVLGVGRLIGASWL